MTPARDDSLRTPLGERGYIGLSFSGGGYRATAFSLGTMALLQDLGLLNKARVMSSVSGGSLALAAYVCAKAGAHPNQESEFRFYERFWDPLMLALSGEELADAFVRLPLLLHGEKVILHAADATQRFLSSLLGEEARLGDLAITDMLRNRTISPDYVYFNAANIASLDLFRFGIQRGTPSKGDEVEGAPVDPVYVLNRYYLQAEDGSVEANELYSHARNVRLGDCVAASFAFPGGFEPLIFPHDYFRPGHSPGGNDEAAKAREHFSGSLICDRRPYVAFLDGGLYDNLGLASVEDIRRYLLRRTRDLSYQKGQSREREQTIRYVIATDVDNIQQGIGFYEEPSLDRHLVETAHAGERSGRLSHPGQRRPLRPWGKVVSAALGMGLMPLQTALVLGLVIGLLIPALLRRATLVLAPFGAGVAWQWGLVVLALLFLLFISLALLWRWIRRGAAAVGQLLRSLLRWLESGGRTAITPPSWRQRLGLSRDFDRQGIDNDLVSWLLRAGLAVLRSPDRAAQLDDLRTATLERRLGQLLPAFNGYLKRTRSLTYGYLQQTYDPADGGGTSASEAERCHLIRNMIFELIPGPDVDPAYASNLITLPVQDYRLQEAIAPMAPIMRKLRHADYVRDLLDRRAGRSSPPHIAAHVSHTRPMVLPLMLLEQDQHLQESIEQLNLSQAAVHWSWLTASLDVDGDGAQQGAPNPTIYALVKRVHSLLRKAKDAASHEHPGFAEPMLRQRCAIKLSETATSYSFIPLICEMATNLNTTLWVKGFCWYVPNQLENQRITAIGGWYVEPPPQHPDRLLLDLRGLPAPAAAITALAGYINTCFNLLEFFYTSLGSSERANEELVAKLSAANEPVERWEEELRQDLLDLPFQLRNSTFEKLKLLSQLSPPPIKPGQVALLEPWLMVREGFPDAWRETQRDRSG